MGAEGGRSFHVLPGRGWQKGKRSLRDEMLRVRSALSFPACLRDRHITELPQSPVDNVEKSSNRKGVKSPSDSDIEEA